MSPLELELLALAWQMDLDMLQAAQSARTILGIDAHGPEGRALTEAVCALVSKGYVEFGSFERTAPWQPLPGSAASWKTSAADVDALKRYLAENAARWVVFPGDVDALRRYLAEQWALAAHPLHIGEIGWIRVTAAGKRAAGRLGIDEGPLRRRDDGGD